MGGLWSSQVSKGDRPENVSRQEANRLFQQRNACFQQSQDAYTGGDRAGAKTYSLQAREFDRRGKAANKQAAKEIFESLNGPRPDGQVDLHGLYVSEAITQAELHIKRAQANGQASLVFIVGRGLHSVGGVSKLAPAIQSLAERHSLRCEVNSPNAGCLTIHLVPEAQPGRWCAIM